MTDKPQTLWVVLATASGYQAQRVVVSLPMVLLCDDLIVAPTVDELRARLPDGLHEIHFPFTDPTVVEAWAA